jgi:hypothetical protein
MDLGFADEAVPHEEALAFGRALEAALAEIPDEDVPCGPWHSQCLEAPKEFYLATFSGQAKDTIRKVAKFALKGPFIISTWS